MDLIIVLLRLPADMQPTNGTDCIPTDAHLRIER
jgi:hypothetical protein